MNFRNWSDVSNFPGALPTPFLSTFLLTRQVID